METAKPIKYKRYYVRVNGKVTEFDSLKKARNFIKTFNTVTLKGSMSLAIEIIKQKIVEEVELYQPKVVEMLVIDKLDQDM